ncbi:hypothetical protein NQ276_24115, partial [Escherichia coli]|nr:hypothetical protein [Escherichia coli]
GRGASSACESRQPPSIENLRRINSGGFSAIFRRIYFNADTSGLSTDAKPRATAASTAQEAKDQIDDRDRAMFFLLRLAFWLGLV